MHARHICSHPGQALRVTFVCWLLMQAYTNPQGPRSALEEAAAVCAHEAQGNGAEPGASSVVPNMGLGASQGSPEQGVAAVQVV